MATNTLLTLLDGCLAYGHWPLLDHAEFALEARERVGLVGRNGAGKSSLLKILAGTSEMDAGQLVRQQGVQIAYVAQEPEFDLTQSVQDCVAQGLGEQANWLAEWQALHAAAPLDAAQLARVEALQHLLDTHQAWQTDSRVQRVLSRLNLAGDAVLGKLSGGMKKRVALARALVAGPDILILDEPTNHLDFVAIQWLEEFLIAWPTTILFVTHDRQFLDRVATRIVELEHGKLRSYPGNFSAWQTRKQAELHAASLEQARFDKLLAQEEIWIRQGVEARRTRSVGRVARLEALRRQRALRRDQVGRVKLEIDAGERTGKVVADLQSVSKVFADQVIVQDFSATILRGDKVGVIGPNGAGKTTLLRLLLGELAPDHGEVKLGSQLQIAYFDQMRSQLELEQTLADVISPGSEWIEINGQRKHVMSYLSDFLFVPARARSPVQTLSGGERNRLLLARLFANPANVLVLDEPTNDLDIETLELLEERLQNYPGTVFLVSHDRQFLDNVVTCTIAAEGAGRWREYPGGYADWLQQSSQANRAEVSASATTVVEKDRPATVVSGKRIGKLNYQEQRELNALPEHIAELESEQQNLCAQLAAPGFYQTAAQAQQQATQRLQQIEDQLMQAMSRWEELEAKASLTG